MSRAVSITDQERMDGAAKTGMLNAKAASHGERRRTKEPGDVIGRKLFAYHAMAYGPTGVLPRRATGNSEIKKRTTVPTVVRCRSLT